LGSTAAGLLLSQDLCLCFGGSCVQAQKAIDQGRQSSEKLEISHGRLELISVELDKQAQVQPKPCCCRLFVIDNANVCRTMVR
jgi:hypothetical protein